jgi:hypothetical protein
MLLEAGGGRDDRPEPDEPPRGPLPRPSWRPFAWLALVCWLLFLAPALGGVAGYALFLAAVTLGAWRIERWAAAQAWGALRQHRQ